MPTRIRQFLKDEGGATAIEYGLVAALIFFAIIAAVQLFANSAAGAFAYVMANVAAAIG